MNGDLIGTNRYFGGQISLIPAGWQSLLGGDALICSGPGQGVISVETSYGVALSAITLADIPLDQTAPTINAVNWTGWRPQGSGDPQDWNSGSMSGAPNITGSVGGGVLTVSSVLCQGLTFGANSWVTSAAFPTHGVYYITAPISVNADGTGTYQLGTLTWVTSEAAGTTNSSGALSGTLAKPPLPKTAFLTDGTNTFVDANGDGNLWIGAYISGGTTPGWTNAGSVSGTINYTTGAFSITGALASTAVTADYAYYSTAVPANCADQQMHVSNTTSNICQKFGTSIPFGWDDFWAVYEKGVGCVAFVPGSRTVLVSSFHEIGPHGGYVPEGTAPPGSPSKCPQCGPPYGGSGTNAPMAMRTMFFDLKEIIYGKTRNGSPSTVYPYAISDTAFPNQSAIYDTIPHTQSASTCAGWMCVDSTNNLIYASSNYGATNPYIHCWSIVWTAP